MALSALGGGGERTILIVLAVITVVLAAIVLVLLRRVERLVRHVDSVFVWQHRRRTPVATIAGLVGALERGLEEGGLQPNQRAAIYRAIDEQLELFFGLDETSPYDEDEHDDRPHGARGRIARLLGSRELPKGPGIASLRADP